MDLELYVLILEHWIKLQIDSSWILWNYYSLKHNAIKNLL